MTITDFFLQWDNKILDADGVYGGQCVDVIKQYFKDVLGISPINGNAIDYWRDIPGFTRIKNSLTTYPVPGDIIIWGTIVNPNGHIAVCNWVRTFDLNVFEQNSPLGSPCHFGTHSYKGVLGWLRPDPKPPIAKVAFIGISPTADLVAKVLEFSGDIILAPVFYDVPPIADFSTEEAMALIQSMNIKEHYVIIGCTAQSGFDKASYDPSGNRAFAICLMQASTADFLHEMLHCFRKYAEFNHFKPYIADVEHYPTSWADAANVYNSGWEFASQYKEVVPYIR